RRRRERRLQRNRPADQGPADHPRQDRRGARMRAFTNAIPRDLKDAAAIAQRARGMGQVVAFAGGGSDVLAQMKDRIIAPDVLVYLKTIKGLDTIVVDRGDGASVNVTIGGLTTLDALAEHVQIRRQYEAIAEAADTIATPQIRNVATVAGNICQRPWC